MKRLAILFIAVVVLPPVVRGEQSPSRGIGGVSAPGAMLARDVIVPLPVVTRFFPEAIQEMSTGQNETAVRNPGATRSVIYTNSDKSKKVTISVDQYATSSDASAAYEEAVQKSRSVPDSDPLTHQISAHRLLLEPSLGERRRTSVSVRCVAR